MMEDERTPPSALPTLTTKSGQIAPPARKLDPKMLELLSCPLTNGSLQYDAQRQELISLSAKLAFPIRDGIPILVADAARILPD